MLLVEIRGNTMKTKIEQLQGIRALAILGIFMSHTKVFISNELGFVGNTLGKLGASGVYTFLILSGILFSLKNTKVESNSGVVKNAWYKVSKLYPLHICMIIVALIGNFSIVKNEPLKYICYLPFNITLTQSFLPISSLNNSFNGSSWFLSSLFGCWLIIYMFPTVFCSLREFSRIQNIKGIIVILSIQTLWLFTVSIVPWSKLPINRDIYMSWLTYNSPLLCLSILTVGIMFGGFIKHTPMTTHNSNILSLIVLLCVIIVNITSTNLGQMRLMSIEIIIFMGVYGIINNQSIGAKILSNRILVWIGDRSGVIFLVHGPVNYCLRNLVTYIRKPILFFISLIITLLICNMVCLITEMIKRERKLNYE